jgi:hypothetical protein
MSKNFKELPMKNWNEIRADRARQSDIRIACALAEKPERAAAFIAAGKSVGEVLTQLVVETADARWDRTLADLQARIDAGLVIGN